jgi:uncharacterized Ntn-hydrolase superfamily protein
MKTVKIFSLFIIFTCISGLLTFYTNQDQLITKSSANGTKKDSIPSVATFSIVAFDPNTKELGIAVQSKVISVGSIVPWAKAGVGAVATQSYANTKYGPDGLKLLEEGLDPNEVIKKLTAADPEVQSRPVGIVDATGRAATFTGEKCNGWAGGRTGKYYTVQGNILAGQGVVDGMAEAFEKSKGELGIRLISALDAGQAAGGDKRGRQSAALLLVREGWGYGGFNDRYRDLRVDDNPEPIKELRRIYEIHKQVFPQPSAGN